MCCKWKNACKVSIKNRIDVKILTTNEKKKIIILCHIYDIIDTPKGVGLRGGGYWRMVDLCGRVGGGE